MLDTGTPIDHRLKRSLKKIGRADDALHQQRREMQRATTWLVE
jgi:hypothetical protein